MRQQTYQDQIDLYSVFPSLFVSLDGLKNFPYDAGWFLGCVNYVANCYIETYARANPYSDVNEHLSRTPTFARVYLRDLCSSKSYGVDIDEMADAVRKIFQSYVFSRWRRISSFIAVTISLRSRIQSMILTVYLRIYCMLK